MEARIATDASSDRRAATRRPRGRRAGGSTTREQILAAARDRFARQGYARTTVRAVAADAGVDPALVHYFYGSKDRLFAAAMALAVNPAEIIAEVLQGERTGIGERLVRRALEAWDEPEAQASLAALVRSAASHDAAAATLRGFVEGELVPRLAAVAAEPEPALRAALVGSQLGGLIVARYILGIEPLASSDRDRLVASIGPTLERYLLG
jgi:AcrR family transcriptional regulator